MGDACVTKNVDVYVQENGIIRLESTGLFIGRLEGVEFNDLPESQKSEQLETERMRLVACGVAAGQNTESSIKDRIQSDNPYYSGSYQSVCDAVDREIKLRDSSGLSEKLKFDKQELENAVKCAYRKHWLNDDSIGWDELGSILHSKLCNSMGDQQFIEWASAIAKPPK